MTPLEYAAYVFGVSLIIWLLPGQVFFLSVNEGTRGLRSGIMLALGVLTGMFLLVSLFAVGFLIILQGFLKILSIVGAVLLLWLGASAIKAGLKGTVSDRKPITGSPFSRGFLLTVMNPPYILWLLTVGSTLLYLGRKSLGGVSYWIFSLGVIAPSIMMTLILVILANFGRNMITPAGLRVLLLLSGSAFIILAAILVTHFLQL